jgi:DNA-binding transcriptional ArsR family regulator
MELTGQKQLLDMLKALADESRLTLLQLVCEQEHTVGDLAERVSLSEPTVSHHLARLREAGLVTLRMAGNHRFYRINAAGLAKFKHLTTHIEHLPPPPEAVDVDDSWIAALGWDASDQQVLHDYTVNRRLTHLPTKQKKLIVILRWLATLFQPDTLYTEPEVNTILKAVYSEDHVSLRRDLVDFGYLRRERGGGKYWLAPADEEN